MDSAYNHSKTKTIMLLLFENIFPFIKKLLVFPGVFFLVLSCENDIQRIKSLSNTEMPDISGESVEMIYTDSSVLQLKLSAEKIKKYSNVERPYIEFTTGIFVEFYDSAANIETTIKANHAFYFTDEKFWEARGNVVVNNFTKNQQLNSEELFWDENEKIIYSNTYTKIETEDDIYYGQTGFESNERFTQWKLKGSKLSLSYEDEPEDEE